MIAGVNLFGVITVPDFSVQFLYEYSGVVTVLKMSQRLLLSHLLLVNKLGSSNVHIYIAL